MSLFHLSHEPMADPTYPMMIYLGCMAQSFEFQGLNHLECSRCFITVNILKEETW